MYSGHFAILCLSEVFVNWIIEKPTYTDKINGIFTTFFFFFGGESVKSVQVL